MVLLILVTIAVLATVAVYQEPGDPRINLVQPAEGAGAASG
jgi:hypothetical protein